MPVSVGSAVKVLAVFGDGRKLRPLRFLWSGRTYKVKEITLEWDSFHGREKIHHFSVSDGANIYELAYHSESMLWTLESVEEM